MPKFMQYCVKPTILKHTFGRKYMNGLMPNTCLHARVFCD